MSTPERTSREQLVHRGAELESVELISDDSAKPEPGSKAEKRAERLVGFWFLLSVLLAIGFIIVFTAWPDEYVAPGQDGYALYALYTPMLGITFGGAILALGIGLITYIKKFYPNEVSVQQRHDGRSAQRDRQTTVALLEQAAEETGWGRRRFLRRAGLAAGGMFGVIAGVLAVGPFVRYPYAGGDLNALFVTGWKSLNGETVYLRSRTGVTGNIRLVRPEDMTPGSMQTVFPYRQSDRGDEGLLLAARTAADTPVALFRFPPSVQVDPPPGQQGFNYGDFYAFSKVCTHLGCAAGIYDSQTQILMCPCHQSQFLLTEGARVVFGPATRPLPQLPITVNEEGYFVATSDFVEPVGPAFWELNTQ